MNKNQILMFNMEIVLDSALHNNASENFAQKVCNEIERNDHDLFFFVDTTYHDCYIQRKNLDKLMKLFHDKDINIGKEILDRDYGQYLYEMYGDDDEIKLGRFFKITNEQLFAALSDEFLTQEGIIQELVDEALEGNFYQKLEDIKKEVLRYYLDMGFSEARDNIEQFSSDKR